MTLEELIAQMNAQNANSYTPLTAEQIQKQAQTRYEGTYGQKKLSAQQAYETSDQALAQQLAGLQATYDKQREQSRENYAQAASQADRQALGRGMQRSSYNNATISNINLKGAKAQQEISDTQAAQTANLNEQRALLAKQLAAQNAQYDAAMQSDMLAYQDELEAREYERQLADSQYRNQLAMQLYEYQYNKDQDALAQQNWQTQMDYQKAQDALSQENWIKEFEAAYGGGDDGGYSGGGSSDSSSKNSSSLWDALGSGKTNTLANTLSSQLSAFKKATTKDDYKTTATSTVSQLPKKTGTVSLKTKK